MNSADVKSQLVEAIGEKLHEKNLCSDSTDSPGRIGRPVAASGGDMVVRAHVTNVAALQAAAAQIADYLDKHRHGAGAT